MEKNITKNFENQNITQENNFDSIKITLASPDAPTQCLDLVSVVIDQSVSTYNFNAGTNLVSTEQVVLQGYNSAGEALQGCGEIGTSD